MKLIRITNLSNEAAAPILAKYCQSFFCQLRGLMFTRKLPMDRGLLLVQGSQNRMNASIHMMFMLMDLAVVWIDDEHRVVDRVLARRWKVAYIPKKAARYVLETGTDHLSEYNIGDKLSFEEIFAQ